MGLLIDPLCMCVLQGCVFYNPGSSVCAIPYRGSRFADTVQMVPTSKEIASSSIPTTYAAAGTLQRSWVRYLTRAINIKKYARFRHFQSWNTV